MKTEDIIKILTKGQKFIEKIDKDEDGDKASFIQFNEPITIETGCANFHIFKIAYWNNEDWMSLYGEGGVRIGILFPSDTFSIRKDSHLKYFYVTPIKSSFLFFGTSEIADAIVALFRP